MQKIEDCREELVNRFNRMMVSKGYDNVSNISELLVMCLGDYEVMTRSTEVAVQSDDSNFSILRDYLIDKQIKGCTESTLKTYKYTLDSFFGAVTTPYKQITSWEIKSYLANKKNASERITDTYMLNVYRNLSSFFAWCYDNELIVKNPMKQVSVIKTEKKIKKAFTKLEMDALYNACKNEKERALIHFLYSTGCRVSEVSNVKIDDIDFVRNEVRIMGKGRKERIAYLNDVAMKYIKKYIVNRKEDSEFLFVGNQGNSFTKAGIESMVREIGERAKISVCHPHKFRRTLATDLFNQGVDILLISKMLGHSNVAVTQRYLDVDINKVKMAHEIYCA